VLRLGFNEAPKSDLQQEGTNEFLLGTSGVKFEMDGDKVKQLVLSFGGRNVVCSPFDPKAAESETPAKEMPNENEANEKVAEEAPKFTPSSPESLAADRAISSPNWTSFRGFGGRGVAEGQNPPVKWNLNEDGSESENIKWRTEIQGLGLSCPSIFGERIFLTSAYSEQADGDLKIGLYGNVDSVEEDYEFDFNVYCLDKKTGDLIWKKTAITAKPKVKRHTKSSHANPTVATDGQYAVAFFGSEGLYCYDVEGELVWKKDLGFLDSGWFYDPGYQWGFGSSPIIFENKVYVQCDIQKNSFVAAYDLATGDEVWKTGRDEIPSWSTPTIHEFGETAMLLTHATKAARGYDARTGELLWTLPKHSEIVVPTPNVAHGLIFLASGYSPIQPIYAIRPEARGDISLPEGTTTNEFIPWSTKRGGPYMPSPIIYGDYLYCCANSGILSCHDAKSGAQVYKKRMRADGGSLSFTASPVAGDGHLYFTAEDGRILVVKAGPEYELVQTNRIGESVLATPAISDGVFYVRTQKSLIAIGK
jgi:outer membrane protein assembly factor BamB